MKKIVTLITLIISFNLYSQSPGNALNFDGTNDMVVVNTTPPFFSNLATTDFTFEAWVNPSASAFQRIIFVQPSTTNFATFGTGAGNVIYFYVIENSTTYSSATTTSIPTSQWTHVACRWTTSSNSTEVFFNGVLQPTVAGGGSSTGTSGLMTLGTRPGGFQYFNGSMDEVRVWSEARTQCEIQSNMNAEFTSAQPNLAAYYNFNQGIPAGPNAPFTNLPDINATYNGTLTNFALSGAISNWIASGAVINSVGPISGPTSSISNTICANDTFMFGGQPLTMSGTYMDTVTTVTGCDSVVTLNLTVLPPNDNNFSVAVCDSFNFNSMVLTSSGIYYDTLAAFNGCDSMVTLNLTVYPPNNNNISISACDSFDFNSTILTSSGIYYDTLPAFNGCDSTVTLNLTINSSETEILTETACDYYIFNGDSLFSSGVYFDTLTTTQGCDSVVMLDLTINFANATVNQAGNVLSSNALGAVYQWLDCDNSFAIIAGETNDTLIAIANGDYAVQVTENGCTDTSACLTVVGFGIDPLAVHHLNLFPNPTAGMVYVQSDANVSIESAQLLNVNGEVIQTFMLLNGTLTTIDLSNYSAGVYFVQAMVNGKQENYRIMKK